MAKARKLSTPFQVAVEMGADPYDHDGKRVHLDELNKRISRRAYKNTGCGAWMEVVRRSKPLPPTQQRWVAEVYLCAPEEAPAQLRVLRARCGHRSWLKPKDLPTQVKLFLCVKNREPEGSPTFNFDPKGTIDTGGELALPFLERCEKAGDSEWTQVHALVWRVRFKLGMPRRGPERWVLRVGSIVEGADAEVRPVEVRLPCTVKQVEDAMQQVEDEADRIWNDTHGCEDCNEGGAGGAIDPECKTCGGHGIII